MNKYIAIAGKHPLLTALGILGAGLFILFFMGAFKQPQSSAAISGTTSYSLASAAQIAANQSIQLANISAASDVAKAKLAYDATTGINALWAQNKVDLDAADNQTTLNVGEQALDAQSNDMTILNAKNQFALNVGAYNGAGALDTLINSGYLTAH